MSGNAKNGIDINGFYRQSIEGLHNGISLPVRTFLLFVHIYVKQRFGDGVNFELQWIFDRCDIVNPKDQQQIIGFIVNASGIFILDNTSTHISYVNPDHFGVIDRLIDADYQLTQYLPYVGNVANPMRYTSMNFILEMSLQQAQAVNFNLAYCLSNAFFDVLMMVGVPPNEVGNPNVLGLKSTVRNLPLFLTVISGYSRFNPHNVAQNPPIMDLLFTLFYQAGVGVEGLTGIMISTSFDQITINQAAATQDIFVLPTSEAVRLIWILHRDKHGKDTLQNALITTLTRAKQAAVPTTYFDVDFFTQVLSEYN